MCIRDRAFARLTQPAVVNKRAVGVQQERLGRDRGAELFRGIPARVAVERNDPAGMLQKRCTLYTSDAADDLLCGDLGGRRCIQKKKKTQTPYLPYPRPH